MWLFTKAQRRKDVWEKYKQLYVFIYDYTVALQWILIIQLNNPAERKSAKPRLYLRAITCQQLQDSDSGKICGWTMRNSRYARIFSVIRVLRFLKDYQLSHSCRNPARRFSCILPCCHTSASYFLRSSCFPLTKQTSLEDTRNVSSTRLASSIPPLVLIFVSAQVHADMTKLANNLASCVLKFVWTSVQIDDLYS